ncbi:MAG: trigger factor [Lachnospiraceae bacterium]|nr:trigger factor [Lachnospiraceae bacterium]
MKKRFALVLSVGLLIFALAGCGDKDAEANAENNEVKDEVTTEKVDSLVTLGEYKGIEVSVDEPFVADEEVEAYALNMFENYVTEEIGIKDRAVEKGDKVYLSYLGKIDGEAFEGGTSSGYMLEIGSGTFIPGFEDQLIGAMPGDTVDVTVTFPENYSSESVAGKEAVFTCEIFWIMPEMNDETVKALDLGYESMADMLDDTKNYLLQSQQSSIDADFENRVVEAAMNNATFGELPEDLVNKYVGTVESSLNNYAAYSGVDVDTFCNMYYGTDSQTMIDNLSVEYAKQDLFFNAIAEAEGLTLDDAALEERLNQYAVDNGYEKADDIVNEQMTREQYRDFFLFDDVITFLVDNAKVTKN